MHPVPFVDRTPENVVEAVIQLPEEGEELGRIVAVRTGVKAILEDTARSVSPQGLLGPLERPELSSFEIELDE